MQLKVYLFITLAPTTIINGSDPNVLVGQTVELFCYISLPGIVTIPNNINYTVTWFRGPSVVFQSSSFGSLTHTYTIESVSLNDTGYYRCAVDQSEPDIDNSFILVVLSG